MSTGKSTALLQVAHNYESTGHQVVVFTSGLDNRHGVGLVKSRLGIQRDARIFDAQTNFLTLDLSGVSCVLTDESQFLKTHQVEQLHRLCAFKDVPVICFGLRTDFTGKAFEGSAALLALADKIEELKTICACGQRKASMNLRVDENGAPEKTGPQVEIGGSARYISVCPRCFYTAMGKP